MRLGSTGKFATYAGTWCWSKPRHYANSGKLPRKKRRQKVLNDRITGMKFVGANGECLASYEIPRFGYLSGNISSVSST